MNQIFPIIILNARPAAGKSEIIKYLKSAGDEERRDRFHLGSLLELDDFPMLWTWFEEDAILAELHRPRLHTDDNGYFIHDDLWNLLIRRIGLEYNKLNRDTPDLHENATVLIEFSRGSQHGGYREAFNHLGSEILELASVLYVDVSYEESVRKNKRRFNPDRPDSVLEHGLPPDKMERLYKATDWHEFSSRDPSFLQVKEHKVPYVVLDNSDDVTTAGGEILGDSLESVLSDLWNRADRLRD